MSGSTVAINANTYSGYVFDRWEGAAVANPSASSTTLVMPASNASVTARFRLIQFALNVVNGSGSGSYVNGESGGWQDSTPHLTSQAMSPLPLGATITKCRAGASSRLSERRRMLFLHSFASTGRGEGQVFKKGAPHDLFTAAWIALLTREGSFWLLAFFWSVGLWRCFFF